MKIRFYENKEKPLAAETRQRLDADIKALELKVVADDSADIVIALGGDGTFLRAVHEFPGMPLLGFNLGGLGYLANVGDRDFTSALMKLATGRYQISERRMIEVNGRFAALNATIYHMGTASEADGKLVTRYMADGLIFATPTGSTAYSLAAGGPVLMPDSDSFVVTPMNPHALGVRPLVVKDSVRFTVTACSRTAGNVMRIGVCSDGENVMTLDEGMSVEIARSAKTAKLIELEGYDPYEVLARKLGWSGSNVK